MDKYLFSLGLVTLSSLLLRSQDIITIDNILYTINDGTAEVARQDRELSGDIVIPSTIIYGEEEIPVKSFVAPTALTHWSNNTVTCEGGTFQDCENITSLTILADITEIPDGCFYDCHSLAYVSMPESIHSIGKGAFANCISLTEVEIPNAVKVIETYTFGRCQGLKGINLTNNIKRIENGGFKDSGIINIQIPISVTFLGEQCLSTSELRNVKVPFRNLDNVDCSLIAFENITNCSLTVPKGAMALYLNTEPWSTFSTYIEYDDGIDDIVDVDKEDVTIDGLRYWIHYSAQYAEIGKQSNDLAGDIVIPEYVECMDFKYPVTSITGPTDMTSYSNGSAIAKGGAFQDTKITSITIPSTISKIPVGAFQGCINLTNVILPQSVKVIECAAFAECKNLSEIELPANLEELGSASFGYGYKSYVFGQCSNLKSITIPANINRIGQGAFMDSGLTSLELSSKVTSIEEHSLRGTHMESLTIHQQDARTLKYTDSSFGDLSDCILYVPTGSKYLYQEFYPWINCADIIEIEDGQMPFETDVKVAHIDGVRYFLFEDGTATVQRQNIELDGDIKIPSEIEQEGQIYNVTGIVEPTEITAWSSNRISTEGGAFHGCPITSITLPPTITAIPGGTFFGCKDLKDVNLPSELKIIGAAAFAECTALEELFVPESVTDFGCDTRYGYKSYVFGECRNLKKINIPSNFTSIPEGCFKNSGLNTMLIPETMTSLETGCFELPDLQFVKIKHKNLSNLAYTESIFPDDISNVILLVPEGSKEVYSNFYPWKKFKAIEEYEATNDDFDFNAYSLSQNIIIEDATESDPEDQEQRFKIKDTMSGFLSTKIYLPSGIHLDDLPPLEIEGYTFVGWQDLPPHMPGEDINANAVYRITENSVVGLDQGKEKRIMSIYSLDGRNVGNCMHSLPNGIYLIRYQDGLTKKITYKNGVKW